jgi:hypothetical protein
MSYRITTTTGDCCGWSIQHQCLVSKTLNYKKLLNIIPLLTATYVSGSFASISWKISSQLPYPPGFPKVSSSRLPVSKFVSAILTRLFPPLTWPKSNF